MSHHIHGSCTDTGLCFCNLCNFSITWMIYSFVVMEGEDQLQTEKCESECLQCQWVRGLSDHWRLTDTYFTALKRQFGILYLMADLLSAIRSKRSWTHNSSCDRSSMIVNLITGHSVSLYFRVNYHHLVAVLGNNYILFGEKKLSIPY